MKGKSVIKVVAVILLSIFILYAYACGEQPPSNDLKRVSGPGGLVKTALFSVKEQFLYGLVLKRSMNTFLMLSDFTDAYIDEMRHFIGSEFVNNSRRRKELEYQGYTSSGFTEVREVERIDGVTLQVKGDIYIDEEGAIHLLYRETDGEMALDFTIDLTGFWDYADRLLLLSYGGGSARKKEAVQVSARPGTATVFLHDWRTSQASSLFDTGEVLEVPALPEGARKRVAVRFGLQSFTLAGPLDPEKTDLIIAVEYPYTLGRGAVYTFGLIAIVILTILFLWLVLFYTASLLKERGVISMGEKKKKPDVISEIDGVLSGPGVKGEPAAEQTQEDKGKKKQTSKQLEEDGIFIEQ